MTLVEERPMETALCAELLFKEARQRRQRRWTVGVVFVVACAVAIGTGFALTLAGPATSRPTKSVLPLTAAATTSAIPGVAWIDYYGRLHVGDPLTQAQRVMVAHTGASATTPLVEANGRVYWVDTSTNYSPISGDSGPTVRDVNLRTGAISNDGFGRSIFLSTDKHHLFIIRNATDLAEVPVSSPGQSRLLLLPSGWTVSSGAGFTSPLAVANGIIVQRQGAGGNGISSTLGIWNPGSNHIEIIGHDLATIDAYTPVRGQYSLLAWVPGSCTVSAACSIKITNTKKLSTVSVPDPLPYGFDVGGAFSSNGSRLAVFVKTNTGALNPTTQLAIANTQSGTLRMVKGATVNIGESVGWAQWLPGDRTLIGGAVAGVNFTSAAFDDNHYMVDVAAMSASPFTLVANRNLDINFSAVAFASPH